MPADRPLQRLYPEPGTRALTGLYLDQCWRGAAVPGPDGCFVYANFVASLDGRIATVAEPGGRLGVPAAIANPRDWRLYLELAAQADVLLVSGRYVRELAAGTAQAGFALSGDAPADLLAVRARLGLPPRPALAVLSASLQAGLGDKFVAFGTTDEPTAQKVSIEYVDQPTPEETDATNAQVDSIINAWAAGIGA